jgi:hypothetical protein
MKHNLPDRERPWEKDGRVRGLRDLSWGGPVTVYDARTMKVKRVIKHVSAYEEIIRAGMTRKVTR